MFDTFEIQTHNNKKISHISKVLQYKFEQENHTRKMYSPIIRLVLLMFTGKEYFSYTVVVYT